MEGFYRGKRGHGFKPDKGILAIFRHDRVQLLQAVPPRAWVKTQERPQWTHNRGGCLFSFRKAMLRVRRYERARQQDCPRKPSTEAIAAFLELVDERYKQELKRYEHDRSWQMYSFFYRCPGGLELATTNRALAFLLGNLWEFHKTQRPLRSARSLLRKKRKDIAAYCGFPRREAVVRILARMPIASLRVPALNYLRDVLQAEENLKRLCHLPRINTGVIRLVGHPDLAAALSHHFFIDLGQQREGDSLHPALVYIVRDTINLHHEAGLRTPVFHSVAELRDVHDALVFGIKKPRRNGRFPEPPIKGTESIVPLRCSRDLWNEARQQKNCLGLVNYAAQVLSGRLYIYRVMQPQRATLALQRKNGRWELRELAGKCNAAPAKKTRRAVEDWLRQVQR